MLVFPIEDPSISGRLGLELRSRFRLAGDQPGQRGQEIFRRARDVGGGERDGRVKVCDRAVSPAVSVEASGKAQADRHDGFPSSCIPAARLSRHRRVTLLPSLSSRWVMWVKLGQGQGCRHHDSLVLLLPRGCADHAELVDEPRHSRRRRGPHRRLLHPAPLPHSPGHRGSACLDALEQSVACTTEVSSRPVARGRRTPTAPGPARRSSPQQWCRHRTDPPAPPPGLHVGIIEILDVAPLSHDRRVGRVGRASWPWTQPQRDLHVRQRQPLGRRSHHPSTTEHGVSAPENTSSLPHPASTEPGLTPLRTHSLPLV